MKHVLADFCNAPSVSTVGGAVDITVVFVFVFVDFLAELYCYFHREVVVLY